MNVKELKKLVSDMNLEEKALQLTQYPVYELDESAEAVVTGLCDLGGIDREALWRTGTILNAPNGETVQSRCPATIGIGISSGTEKVTKSLNLF